MELVIDDCEFIGGTAGADFYLTDSVVVENSRFEGQFYFALAPLNGTSILVEGCRFENQERVMEVLRAGADVVFRGNDIDMARDCSFLVEWYEGSEITAHSNDIAHGDRGTVWGEDAFQCETPPTFDMTDNYWGTDDPDSIAAWIHDRNDNEQVCFGVDFDPFRSESTPVESRSLAEIKQLFR
jgi:hypothetical protein